MFSTRRTRRGLFTAALAGGVALVGGWANAHSAADDLGRLAHRVRHLGRASRRLDYADDAAVAAHYAAAEPVMAAVIAARATTYDALRMKAQAYAWCVGGQLPTADPQASTADRVMASILADLLRPNAVPRSPNPNP